MRQRLVPHSQWTVWVGDRCWVVRIPNRILDAGAQEVAAGVYTAAPLGTYNVIEIGAGTRAVQSTDTGCLTPLMQSAQNPLLPLRKVGVGVVQSGGATVQITATFSGQEIAQSILPPGAAVPKQLVESALYARTDGGVALHRVAYPAPLLLTGIALTIIVDITV